jgi:hypothetical protein
MNTAQHNSKFQTIQINGLNRMLASLFKMIWTGRKLMAFGAGMFVTGFGAACAVGVCSVMFQSYSTTRKFNRMVDIATELNKQVVKKRMGPSKNDRIDN